MWDITKYVTTQKNMILIQNGEPNWINSLKFELVVILDTPTMDTLWKEWQKYRSKTEGVLLFIINNWINHQLQIFSPGRVVSKKKRFPSRLLTKIYYVMRSYENA